MNNKQSAQWQWNAETLASRPLPVQLQFWLADGSRERWEGSYDEIVSHAEETICRAEIESEAAGRLCLEDRYAPLDGAVSLRRSLRVLRAGTAKGLRLWWAVSLEEDFPRQRYFAPPALFDRNDLDEDGYEDYFHTQNLVYRDDRFNDPGFLAWRDGRSARLERDPLPAFDSRPEREVDPASGEKVNFFLQKTDIGGMGVWTRDGVAWLCACYPFYEAEATIGLFISKMKPFGAFYPMEEGAEINVGYRLSLSEAPDFHAACWRSVCDALHRRRPQPRPLAASPEELVRWRLEALNRYYVELDDAEGRPAGYVLNCHPQKGEQLENIIQYGFTGQNLMNAYNVMRYGYEYDLPEYRRRAERIADFFSHGIQLPETGIFYTSYNTDARQVNFWWTGLLLPLAYARSEELESLMGPLYSYRKDVIESLASLKGGYTRCMSEDAVSLLRLYCLTKDHGEPHPDWLETVRRYGEFLLRAQDTDGGWFRAYDTDGDPILEPKIWFGSAVCEQKSSTGSVLPLLTELYQATGDRRYLDAAERGGRFVTRNIIEPVRFNGGVHDSIYAKGQLIDNEGILYPMLGMAALYEVTGKAEYLRAASLAARYCASWVCLWKVPLPKGSTLERYGFNSVGMGACDTCGAGYLHPFQLMCVAEMAQIAQWTKDAELLEIAALYWKGCNQTVQTPENDWGYAYPGLQEEGYLVSWWAADDPMFSSDKGFGNRLKGEGNKTCFPWINAVGVKAYWKLMDLFGTCDFDRIPLEPETAKR